MEPTATDTGDLAELSTEIRNAIGRIYRRFRALRGPGELGDGALAVLTRIRKRGPQTLTALSEHAGVRPSSMSQVVNRLAAGGFVVRQSDPDDGRRVLLQLTKDGKHVAQETIALREDWFLGQLRGLSAEDRATLNRASEILLRIADA